jgi:branched-chain amino acid aminotransferase
VIGFFIDNPSQIRNKTKICALALRQILVMAYNFNGNLIEGDTFATALNNRGLNYGDSIFESMRFAFGRINFWEDHYFRFMASMRLVRMEIPLSFSPEYLEEQVRKTLKANKLESGAARVRLQAIRKSGGLYAPQSNDVDLLITVAPLADQAYTLNEKGLNIDLYKDFYLQKSMLSNLKTGSSLFYVVASVFKQENGFDECLLLNDAKELVEAISANVFLVKDKTVYTPPLSSGCLKGVMRKQVLTLLPKMEYTVVEEPINPFELQRVDEVFLTNASKGIQWVGQYRKKSYTHALADALVKKLNVQAALG